MGWVELGAEDPEAEGCAAEAVVPEAPPAVLVVDAAVVLVTEAAVVVEPAVELV